jgi:hypothetical protein
MNSNDFYRNMMRLLMTPINNNSINNVLMESLNEKPKYIKIISKEGLKELEYVKYDKTYDCKLCPIMMTSFEENEEIVRLPCNHIFKKDAILQWLNEESNKCPVCRKELAFKEKKIDISSNIVDISSNIVDTSSNIVDTSSNIVEDPISQIENLLLGAMSRRMVGYEMAPLSNYINEENSLLENEEMQRALYESLSKNN